MFRITLELRTLVFTPKQHWIGGGEGIITYFCLEEVLVWRKSKKTGETASIVLSVVEVT